MKWVSPFPNNGIPKLKDRKRQNFENKKSSLVLQGQSWIGWNATLLVRNPASLWHCLLNRYVITYSEARTLIRGARNSLLLRCEDTWGAPIFKPFQCTLDCKQLTLIFLPKLHTAWSPHTRFKFFFFQCYGPWCVQTASLLQPGFCVHTTDFVTKKLFPLTLKQSKGACFFR